MNNEDKYETCPKRRRRRMEKGINLYCGGQARQNAHQLSDRLIPAEQLFI